MKTGGDQGPGKDAWWNDGINVCYVAKGDCVA